ncbi:MAG: hypothetical protein C0616_06735 [Desulfuromonas sp.]|nr:MAG: hypothetical protein C0616_06735 [Desulfuromonas sp.]
MYEAAHKRAVVIEETGTIVELKSPQRAMVLCRKSSACQHCSSKEACGLGSDEGTRLVEADNQLGAKVGDKVRIAITSRTLLRSSFLVYIVPLIALLVGAGLGQFIGEKMAQGPDPNLLAALLGSAFMVGSLLVIKVGSKALPQEDYMPRIVRILDDECALGEELKHGN